MKIKVSFLVTCLFIQTAETVLISCNSDAPDQNSQQPLPKIDYSMEVKMVSLDNSMQSFFKKNLFDARNSGKELFIIKEDTCYRIDSKEEIAMLYQGTDELPEIDFSKYTLILGAKIYTDADTDVENCKQILTESEEGYILNICTRHMEGEWAALAIYPLQIYYYGLYPKLKNKEIKVRLIYE